MFFYFNSNISWIIFFSIFSLPSNQIHLKRSVLNLRFGSPEAGGCCPFSFIHFFFSIALFICPCLSLSHSLILSANSNLRKSTTSLSVTLKVGDHGSSLSSSCFLHICAHHHLLGAIFLFSFDPVAYL